MQNLPNLIFFFIVYSEPVNASLSPDAPTGAFGDHDPKNQGANGVTIYDQRGGGGGQAPQANGIPTSSQATGMTQFFF